MGPRRTGVPVRVPCTGGFRFRLPPVPLWIAVLSQAAVLVPATVSAQGGEWPTLSGAGIEYLSESGFMQVSLSGQLDFEAVRGDDSWAGLVDHSASEAAIPDGDARCLRCHVGMGLPGEGGAVRAHRLRLFADIFLGDQLYSLIEVRSDRGHVPSDGESHLRVEQAFVRVSSGNGSAGLQVGRFASPVGSYPQRHLTTVDPFVRPPIAYDYRTVMSRTLVPVPGRILTWKDHAQFFRKPGAPPIWDVPYQWGAMLFGSVGPVDLRLAAVNSAPSSAPEAWDFTWEGFDRPSAVGGVRVRATAALDIGASYSRGPWMERPVAGAIGPPPGSAAGTPPQSYRGFDQELLSVDLNFASGPMMFRAEAIRDRWEIPNVEDRPTERIYSAELQYDLWAGVSVAGRLGYIDFRPLDDGVGGRDDWDYDVYRYEASLGYRLARNAGILLSGYRQIQRIAEDGDTHLIGARLWWAF